MQNTDYGTRDDEDVKIAPSPGDEKLRTSQEGSAGGEVSAVPIIWHSQDYPKLDFSNGGKSFFRSLQVRLKAIFTKRFIACLIWGQVLSLTIVTTSTMTTYLSMNNWQLPTTQSFFVYFFLCVVYTPWTIYSYGFKAWFKMLYTDGWRYFILAAIDVEANFVVVKAYQYTNILSASLLNSLATPTCMIVAYFLVKARYHWSQILGVLVCIVGLALLVVSDFISHGGTMEGVNKPKGDGFAALAAILYGCSNGLEEFLVRGRPLYEVVGQLGFWGVIINGTQAAALESRDWVNVATWSGQNIGYLIGFVAAMLLLYSTAPVLFRASSSPFYNISLLGSNFYALLIGFRVFHLSTYWLYGLAFPLVIIGLVIYFSVRSPEHSTGKTFLVEGRGKKAGHFQDSTVPASMA